MRINCCHRFLAFNLKFLNFLQFFLGISTVIYSAYLLNQWQNQTPFVPSPPSPAPGPAVDRDYLVHHSSNGGSHEIVSYIDPLVLAGAFVSGSESDGLSSWYSIELPAPWFIYSLMAIGLILCFMSCIGHIAAEAINGCCLCFYILLTLVLILLEAALIAFIAIDKRWEQDLPYDPTGELDKLRSFLEKNADICKWVSIALLSVQALSILLSLVLRASLSAHRAESDIEIDYAAPNDRIREPLLNSQPNQSSALMKGEGRGTLADVWTTRIRQKYGLNNESSRNQVSEPERTV